MLELSDHGFCSTGSGDENIVTLLGKSERKRLLDEPGYRQKDNIKINFKRLDWDCVDWLIWLSTEPAMDYCKPDNMSQRWTIANQTICLSEGLLQTRQYVSAMDYCKPDNKSQRWTIANQTIGLSDGLLQTRQYVSVFYSRRIQSCAVQRLLAP
jgi:hypothetical protein